MNIQDAQKSDAEALAYLINLAGEGIPYYLWSTKAEAGVDPFAIGKQRASREEGGFSYTNASVVRNGANVVGMILSYQLDDPYITGDLDDVPEVVRPLVVLESKAPGSWYINAIATVDAYRGKGLATRLLTDAEARASAKGIHQMSLIVASENTSARDLYLKLGYEIRASLPVVDYPGCLHGGNWELMIKTLAVVQPNQRLNQEQDEV